MDRLTAMRVFVCVAEVGSITKAADQLHMTRAMASRYIEHLEQWLGVRLLHRTTRRLSLSLAGEEALTYCQNIVGLSEDVRTLTSLRSHQPTGTLRIAAGTSFAQAYLTGAIATFLQQYPHTSIELTVTEHTVNLVEERIDVAIRITNHVDEALIARKLGVCRSVLCASPRYLAQHSTVEYPEQLQTHRFITHRYVGKNVISLYQQQKKIDVPVHSVFQSNDAAISHSAALHHIGIALLPTYLCQTDIHQQRLVQLLPDYEPQPLDIYAVYLSRQHIPYLLRTFIDFLADQFHQNTCPWEHVQHTTPTLS